MNTAGGIADAHAGSNGAQSSSFLTHFACLSNTCIHVGHPIGEPTFFSTTQNAAEVAVRKLEVQAGVIKPQQQQQQQQQRQQQQELIVQRQEPQAMVPPQKNIAQVLVG